MRALKELLTFVTLFSAVLGNGELAIHHSPNGINFRGNEPIDSSELPNILATANGLSSNMDNTWEGLTIKNPFNYPTITVIVEIEGLASLKLGENTYPFRNTISRQLTKDIFTLNLSGKMIDETDINMIDSTGAFKFEKLSANDDAVAEFIKDLKMLDSLRQKVEKKIDADAIWIQLKGLKNIVREFGQQSEQSEEAVSILNDALEKLESSLGKVYDEKFLLASITEDNHHSRHTRAAKKLGEDPPKPQVGNLSKRYTADYAPIFNIILFTSIFLIAALISTSVFICTLDPGRDSIIYRMTTQRKKDN